MFIYYSRVDNKKNKTIKNNTQQTQLKMLNRIPKWTFVLQMFWRWTVNYRRFLCHKNLRHHLLYYCCLTADVYSSHSGLRQTGFKRKNINLTFKINLWKLGYIRLLLKKKTFVIMWHVHFNNFSWFSDNIAWYVIQCRYDRILWTVY